MIRRSGGFPLPNARIDERDTMFARMARRSETPQYDEYYTRNPQLKPVDDRIREMTPLCQPGSRYYDPVLSTQADEYFEAIAEIVPDEGFVRTWAERLARGNSKANLLKRAARALGAVATGICLPPEELYYTHKGRFDRDYGRMIHPKNQFALVFLVEMDYEAMQRAPLAETIRESARQYNEAARIAKTLAAILEAAGYKATPEYDAHYTTLLVPLAILAGLGELGRHNLLIADRYGTRVRVGAVLTDLPLPLDKPRTLGAASFCERCRKCADNCPPHALSGNERVEVHGVPKWPTNVEACYRWWRTVGTDCGICMATCPFSHRNNLFHNSVRWLVRVAPPLHPLLFWFDDLLYGREWSPKSA